MGRVVSTKQFEDRAIEIYQWATTTADVFNSFTANMIPDYRPTSLNVAAIKMLVDRDLIAVVDCTARPRRYKLKRLTEPSQCLQVPTDGMFTGVTRYKVPPSIASSMARSDNLKQYAIG